MSPYAGSWPAQGATGREVGAMGATNYAVEANRQAQASKDALEAAEETRYYVDLDAATANTYAEAQVHATLAVAYAQLATYTATGG